MLLDVNLANIRNICKIIATTLTKYKDSSSQQLVRNLIINLIRHHHDAVFESMLAVFKILACKELANAPPKKASNAALIALGWTCLFNKYSDKNSNVYQCELPRLIEYQSLLYQIILSSKNEKLIEWSNGVLLEILEINDLYNNYMSILLKKDPASNTVVFVCTIINLMVKRSGIEISSYKNPLIEIFVKGIITAKTKPHPSSIAACEDIMNLLTAEDFEKKILPPMQRSMLRNPEVILQAVGLIIQQINIDMSPYALQLGKIFIQNLCSKDEVTRLESVESLKQLSSKCSDSEIILNLLRHIFSVLNGAEGKITVAEHRISLIQVSFSEYYI